MKIDITEDIRKLGFAEALVSQMAKKDPLVAIIVSNYNGASIKYRDRPILERCLSGLKKTTYGNFKVIVADDLPTLLQTPAYGYLP